MHLSLRWMCTAAVIQQMERAHMGNIHQKLGAHPHCIDTACKQCRNAGHSFKPLAALLT